MKNLLMLLMLMVFVSCNGAGGGSTEPDVGSGNSTNDLIIEYNSYGVFQNTGVSLDQMGTYDENRAFIIPETLELTMDSNGSVQIGDVARIVFVQSNCNYTWNGSNFTFQSCTGALGSASHGDVLYLGDIQSMVNPQMNGVIQFGVIRPMGNNHTGTIVIKGNLK